MKSIGYKYNIGDVITSHNRNLEIIDREIRIVERKHRADNKPFTQKQKFYKYHCRNCGNEDWIKECYLDDTKYYTGCNACCKTPQKIVKGINDVATTAHWMIPYFVDIEDAYTHSEYSKAKVKFKCLDCGKIYIRSVDHIHNTHGVKCACGDGWSYPNKYMYSLLEQIGVTFTPEKVFEWSENKIYDDYIEYNGLKIITEQHGKQHYNRPIHYSKSTEQEKENDIIKYDLAMSHGIDYYFVIDCQESDKEYIKNSICKSGLLDLLNVNQDDINWEQCSSFATSNLVKTVCDFLNENPLMKMNDIALHFGLSKKTIKRYQKLGKQNGWIKIFNRSQLLIDNNKMASRSKPVYCCDNGNYYRNAFDACDHIFGNATEGSAGRLKVCIGKNIPYKDYNFSFITQEEFNRVKSESPSKCFGDFFVLRKDKHD